MYNIVLKAMYKDINKAFVDACLTYRNLATFRRQLNKGITDAYGGVY